MQNLPKSGTSANPPKDNEGLMVTLAHHDAVIVNLASRITSVESTIKSLSDTVNIGFSSYASLSSKMDKFDNRPTFDFSKSLSNIRDIAFLISAVVGCIIWVTTGQFSGVVQKQESHNAYALERMDRMEKTLSNISDRLSWRTSTESFVDNAKRR